MPPLASVQASNSRYAPTSIPTIVLVGGNQGIGQAMAETFARQTGGRANIFLVARNRAAGEKIIATFPPPPPGVRHEFISCDATLMSEVHSACQEVKSKVDKVNYLVLSAGMPPYLKRRPTVEGLDTLMALRYYARAKFTVELLPRLKRARDLGEDARTLSILGAALGRPVNVEDPGLENWGTIRTWTGSWTYNDIMVKVLSEQNPDMSFIHITPGMVDTPGSRFNWYTSLLMTLLLRLGLAVTADVCAQYMLYPLWNARYSSGGHWLNHHDNSLTLSKNITEEVATKIWDHTLEVISTRQAE